jgi:hypothetical protein
MGLDFCIRGNRASYKGNDALVLYHEHHFRFDLIFIKKIINLNFFKKNQKWFKPVWLDFFYFWLSLARFWLGFF